MRTSRIVVAALALFVGCRSNNNNTPDSGGGGGGGDGGGGGGGDGGSGFYTIQQIQSDAMAAGTPVSVQGVVVTAVDLFGPSHEGDMWVEEPGGGPLSGVHVYNAQTSNAALEETLVPGDIVTITGAEKNAHTTDTTGRAEIEIEPVSGGTMLITKTGHQDPIVPDTVDLAAISALYDPAQGSAGGGSAFQNAWAQWDGVVVTAMNVDVFSKPSSGSAMNADGFYMKIEGVAEVDSNMTPIDGSNSSFNFALGSCLGTLTGVVEYYYGNVILPRGSDDLVPGGTCTFENAASSGSACTDGVDNDGNGFADCADLGCEVGSAAWLGDSCADANGTCGCSTDYASGSGAVGINTDNAATSNPVILHGVWVTGIDSYTNGFWFTDTKPAAVGHGGFAYTGTTPTVSVDDQLDTLQGIAGPYTKNGGTIIEITDPTAVVNGSNNVAPLSTSVGSAASGSGYVNVLVKLTNVTAGALGAHNQITLTATNGTDTITLDDDAFYGYGYGSALGSGSNTPPSGCLDVTGVIELNTVGTTPIRTINPRGSADIVSDTGCP